MLRCGTGAWIAVFMAVSACPSWAAGGGGIDPSLCQRLTKHTPSADVAYQAGVDVHGKPVAPPDLSSDGGGIDLPQRVTIPLTLSLAKALNLNTSTYPYNQLGNGAEVGLGTLVVEGNTVTLNGKPLSGAEQDNLAVLCMTSTP